MKTADGFESLCDFYLGNNRSTAQTIFAGLEGIDDIANPGILQVDLIETHRSLPVNVKIKHCTLLQQGRNCCFIAKELFKWRALEAKK